MNEDFKGLVENDWVVSNKGPVLHYIDVSRLDPADVATFDHNRSLTGPVRLACGRTAKWIAIPGIFTRMGAPRCETCCRCKGYPLGKGSPKNDDACRAILGLPAEEAS